MVSKNYDVDDDNWSGKNKSEEGLLFRDEMLVKKTITRCCILISIVNTDFGKYGRILTFLFQGLRITSAVLGRLKLGTNEEVREKKKQ